MDEIFGDLTRQLTYIAPKATAGILVFLLFWFASIVLSRITRRIGVRAHVTQDLLVLIGRTISGALLIFGAITALATVGVNVSALVAGLGLTGFALGFALRDALSNLLAGVLILIYRPFHRNDTISVAGLEGRVIETDLRYTTLQGENKRILIPNAALFSNSIILMEIKDNIEGVNPRKAKTPPL